METEKCRVCGHEEIEHFEELDTDSDREEFTLYNECLVAGCTCKAFIRQ